LWLNITKKELLPPADLFINNEEKAKIAKIITNRFPLDPDITKPKSLQVPGSVKRSFIKIQDGCNHFCSYCIVPHLRTKPTSKNSEQIVREINQAHRAGIREAILCGINLSSYGHDLDPPVSFSYLIKEILEKTTIPRLSLSSLTPKLINQELINIFIADQKKDQRLSSYWHLALQSGSESVLGRMKRQTDLKQLTRSLQYIKETRGLDWLNFSKKEFEERISDKHINPGESYKYTGDYWKKFFNINGKHDYTYNERIRPQIELLKVELLRDNGTRRAYLSVWSAIEDLNNSLREVRVPCTLGYQFLIRNNKLEIIYLMRSSDVMELLDVDIFMVLKLKEHIANELNIEPGNAHFHIGSLHGYAKDMKEYF